MSEKEFYNLTPAEVENQLDTSSTTGLSGNSTCIAERQTKYGANMLSPQKKESLIKKFFEAITEGLLKVLLVFCALSALIGEYKDAVVISFAIALSAGISLVMEGRSGKALDALNKSASNIKVRVLRNGMPEQITSEELVVGDIIHLEPGDKIPADCRIIESIGLKVEESALTGESVAVSKKSESLKGHVPLAERVNCLYAGTFVSEGRCTAIVTAVGDHTEIGKIAQALRDTAAGDTPLQEKLNDFSNKLSKVCIVLTSILFVIKMVQAPEITFEVVKEALVTSIALIVAAVPEGLSAMVALTLSFNMIKMQKLNALVKKIIACETVGSINVICSDKTGTLTQNIMKVVSVYVNGSMLPDTKFMHGDMIDNFIINSTADLGENGNVIGNPTEGALLLNTKENGFDYEARRKEFRILRTVDFTSATKVMITVIEILGHRKAYLKGAPEKLLDRCKYILIDSKVVLLTPEIRQNIEKDIQFLQSKAQRALGFAYKDVEDFEDSDLADEYVFTGFVGIEDPIRFDVTEAIVRCKQAGISVKMLTGDNINTATAIAKQLGMVDSHSVLLEASEVEKLTDEELGAIIDDIVVIARSTPTTKQRIVNLLKGRGNAVAVTGDGVNDAPALKSADVGIAMGITGTEVSKQASDIVLLNDSFATIVTAVKWGRGIFENFQRFITFQLTVNVVAFVTAFAATLMGYDLPFTTIQLLWINIIMDGPPALSLGMEPPRDGLMDNKPIPRGASIVTKFMLFKILSNGLFMAGALLALMKYGFLGGTPEQQSTIVFATLVFFQLWNAFNSRELGTETILTNFTKNRLALGLIGGAALLQIVFVQFGQALFDTVALPIGVWAVIIGFTFSVVVFSEVIKFIMSITGHKQVSTAAQEA
jgi:P-type Ca2+ transporter type 2C